MFYLAGNMQYAPHSRNCLAAKGIKFTWCYILLLVFILMDLVFQVLYFIDHFYNVKIYILNFQFPDMS